MTGARKQAGMTAHAKGLLAEEAVARHYRRAGCQIAARRWRGASGEIDLVLRDRDAVVFVEVKCAATHDRAAGALGPRQAHRIATAAAEFLGTEPNGALTEARFDVALVDRAGTVRILRNVFLGG